MPLLAVDFEHGRQDCATAPTTTETRAFPKATMNRAEMLKYFNDEFGFNGNEVSNT